MHLSRETWDEVGLCYIVRKNMKLIEPFLIEMMDWSMNSALYVKVLK